MLTREKNVYLYKNELRLAKDEITFVTALRDEDRLGNCGF